MGSAVKAKARAYLSFSHCRRVSVSPLLYGPRRKFENTTELTCFEVKSRPQCFRTTPVCISVDDVTYQKYPPIQLCGGKEDPTNTHWRSGEDSGRKERELNEDCVAVPEDPHHTLSRADSAHRVFGRLACRQKPENTLNEHRACL